MGSFEEAQRLFIVYQKTGHANNLRESLDLLDELIEENNADSHRAMNFKKVMSKTVDNQIKGIFCKCNIPQFAKDLKAADDQNFMTQLSAVLSSSLSNADANLLAELMDIASHYFKKDVNEVSKREANFEHGN